MRRHALLYRRWQQRATLPSLVFRQPLVTHLARQQRLPALLLPFARPISLVDGQGSLWNTASPGMLPHDKVQVVEPTDYQETASLSYKEQAHSVLQPGEVLEQHEQNRYAAQASRQDMQHPATVRASHRPKEDVQSGKTRSPSPSKEESGPNSKLSRNTSLERSSATQPEGQVAHDAQQTDVNTDQLLVAPHQDGVSVEQRQEQNELETITVQARQEDMDATIQEEEQRLPAPSSSQGQDISVPSHIKTAEVAISRVPQLPIEASSVPSPGIAPAVPMSVMKREIPLAHTYKRTEEHTDAIDRRQQNDLLQRLHQDRASVEQRQEQSASATTWIQEKQEDTGAIIHDKSLNERHAETDLTQPNTLLQRAEAAHQADTQQSPSVHHQMNTLNLPQQHGQGTQSVEIVPGPRTRPPRARIEEQPSRAAQEKTAPPMQVKRTAETASPAVSNEGPMDLFMPQQDLDRSPQAWAARLRRATGMAPSGEATSPEKIQEAVEQSQGTQKQALTTQTPGLDTLPQAKAYALQRGVNGAFTPSPLSQRARRFLQPLVGIDPASIPVYRNEFTEQLTEQYQADAITTGENVLIGRGYPEDTPETLGLLAHEFTHVARQQTPRFVPPIARVGGEWGSAITPPSVSGDSDREETRLAEGNRGPGAAMHSVSQDEEGMALHVEGRVAQIARKGAVQGTLEAVSSLNKAAPFVAARTIASAAGETTRPIWGNLPAPWEPLPHWLAPLPSTPEASGQPGFPIVQPALPSAHLDGSDGGGNLNGLQRAASDRTLQEEAPASTHDTATTKPPEVDLDLLARQVYSRLKRRLGVERRRESEGE